MNGSESDAGGSGQPGRTRRGLLGALGAGAAAALAGCNVTAEGGRVTADIEFSVPGEEVDRVSLDGGDAEATVRRSESTNVEIEATKYAEGQAELSDVTVTREVSGGQLDVEATLPDEFVIGAYGGGFETVDVRVPDGTQVSRVDIDDGSGEIANVGGNLSVNVDDGEADVGPVDGPVDLTADDGELTVGAVDALTAELDDATLEMQQAATLDDVTVDDGELELAVDGLDGDISVQSDDADVDILVDSGVETTVIATADDGRVDVDSDLFDNLSIDGRTTRGEIGDGGDRLEVTVDDGDVEIGPL